jgi:hypothetical protein
VGVSATSFLVDVSTRSDVKNRSPGGISPTRHTAGANGATAAEAWEDDFVAWLVFLSITIAIARGKGRSGLLWGLLACFFPLITIIVLLLIPARSHR